MLTNLESFIANFEQSHDVSVLLVAADWCDENSSHADGAILRSFQHPVEICDGTIRLASSVVQSKSGSKQVVMKAERVNSKARFPKPVFHYRFRALANAMHCLKEKVIVPHERRKERRTAKKEATTAARTNFVNPHKVGQLLYNSWGYDQTNVDFAQIVAVGPRSVTIRRIGSRLVRSVTAADYVAPASNQFLADHEPKLIAIQFDCCNGTDGKPHVTTRIPGWREVGNREEFYETACGFGH